MNEHWELVERVEEMYRLSDAAVHAILMKFIQLEADEQTPEEL